MQRRKEKAQKNSGEHLVLLQKKIITGSLDCQRGCNQKLLNNYIYALK